MKQLMLIGAFCFCSLCYADDPNGSFGVNEPVAQATKREVSLKIDPLDQEQLQAGLTEELIKEAISKELETGTIYLNDARPLPGLVLRLRTIQVGLDVATYFQLSFQEEAMLVRTRSMYHAVTWSQASILACRPENLKKEVLDTVAILTQTFIKDYNKAMRA